MGKVHWWNLALRWGRNPLTCGINIGGQVNKKDLVKTAFPEETKRAACGSD